jgi:glutamate dehydrogenase (NAD(P)+)
VNRHPHGTAIPGGQELTVDCDILVPAALQDVIDGETAQRIKAGLVVEGANLPTTSQAQEVLARRGITVVPDFVANAGGVVAAAFAMDARYSGFRPGTPAIFRTISDRLRANAVAVLEEAARCGTTPHAAGRGLAEERVRTAMLSKGRIPR